MQSCQCLHFSKHIQALEMAQERSDTDEFAAQGGLLTNRDAQVSSADHHQSDKDHDINQGHDHYWLPSWFTRTKHLLMAKPHVSSDFRPAPRK